VDPANSFFYTRDHIGFIGPEGPQTSPHFPVWFLVSPLYPLYRVSFGLGADNYVYAAVTEHVPPSLLEVLEIFIKYANYNSLFIANLNREQVRRLTNLLEARTNQRLAAKRRLCPLNSVKAN
jgi:hypothetical protein